MQYSISILSIKIDFQLLLKKLKGKSAIYVTCFKQYVKTEITFIGGFQNRSA